MRVLIGVDGSPHSFASVQFVGSLLAADKDAVTLYYSPPPVWVRAVPDASGTAGAAQGFLANAVFEKARQFLPEPLRQKTQTIVGTREPRHGLLIAADECRADLIVIGARGVGHLKQPSLGSIAQYVVHHATTPVLVVRGAGSSPPKPVRVLLASDGSAISRHALEILERFSWPSGTSGHAITVLESSAEGQLPEWLADRLDDQQLAALGMGPFTRDEVEEARIRQEATRWHGTLPAIFRGRDPLVVAGHAGEQILKAIDAQGIDLVIVGARRQGAVRRLLLGSTSEFVLNHSPCSVLIVREPQQS
jgi:nucleotide-binding universal stress UspA family protein